LALSGVAHGYWTTTGSGTGTASAGEARMSLATGDAPTGLYPGGPAAIVRVTLTNTGGGTIRVDSMTPSVSSSTSGCAAPGELALTRLDALPTALTPGSPAGVRYSVAMATDADLGCIGATFTLTFDAAGTLG
jgi:hypothetical protein